ncbi:branched-chain amino acid ABC transporter permease [Trebonia kvetii]|uniref:branched-chain amino acid ABC transporter permease n=1 Tax=Trebonia kvetii TaxID=2480626 RepID=UPI001651C21D|nr:branched-chain amino acid ABC transporter permease [Trebonia kvetii]
MQYLVSLIPLVFIYGILVLGLNLQVGQTGILNLTYFTFVAFGAYISAVLSLPPADPSTGITYILGANLPFPLTTLLAGCAAAILGVLISFAALQRLRSDYLAIVTVGAGYVIYTVVGNQANLFDGWNGLFGISTPVPQNLGPNAQMLFFSGICLIFLVVVFTAVERIRRSPLGRVLRAIRDDEGVVAAFGRDVFRLRVMTFALGCFVAGVGGSLLVMYATAFNPQSFLPPETFIMFAAMIIGGIGNNWGSLLGAAVVPVAFAEATRFIPEFGHAGLVEDLRAVVVGVLLILVLRFMPQGLIKERPPVDRDQPARADQGLARLLKGARS